MTLPIKSDADDFESAEYNEIARRVGASKGYHAVVFKEGTTIYAMKHDGTQITSGAAGTQDAATINSAITDANGAGGGLVVLAPGTFTIEVTVRLKSNVGLRGCGDATILKQKDTTNTFVVEAGDGANNVKSSAQTDNVYVGYLTVDGNKANNTTLTFGIFFNWVINGIIENCIVKNCNDDGIIASFSEHVLVTGCRANASSAGVTLDHDTKNSTVIGNRTVGNVTYGLLAFKLDGCAFIGNDTGQIDLQFCKNTLVEANRIDATGHNEGIHVYKDPNNLVSEDIALIGNHIKSPNNRGIFLNGVQRCLIQGNHIRSAGTDGIRADATALNLELSIIGNAIRDCRIGIYVGVGNGIVNNNRLKNLQQHGIQLVGGSLTPVVGNYISDAGLQTTNTYSAIIITDATEVPVVGNVITSSSANKPKNAVEETGTSDRNRIFLNMLLGTGGARVVTVGSATRVAHNVGYVTEAKGAATILSGTNNVVITHGLIIAPTVVTLGASHAEVADAITDTFTATQLTIRVPSNTTADRVAYWEARV